MHAQPVASIPVKIDPTGFARFPGLSQHQAAGQLMAVSSLQKKGPGETVFAEGDDADSVYEVVRGMLRLYKLLPDGRRQITGFLSAGHLLGLAPEGVCVYTAEAVTEVTLCRYKRAAFERLIDEVPGFARRLLTVASQELCAAQNQMLLLGRKAATEKVASFLLLMADQQGADRAETVSVPMTRSDIADYLGLTIETVSRTLTKLKRDGLIAIPSSAHIEICDRDQLEELAAGESDTGF
jgi:CRP/FNR family transcriptional regulator, anaerobic regulatory protein